MKTKSSFLSIIYLFFSISLFAQGQGKETSEVRQIADFKAISAATAIDVVLQKGNSPSVKIVSEGIDLTDIITEVEGDKLKIYRKSCTDGSGSGGFLNGIFKSSSKKKQQRGHVQAFVTYIQLKKIEAGSAATISGEVIKAPALDISVSSAAKINITDVDTDALSLSASSGAKIDLTGRSGKTTLEASSGSRIKTLNLSSQSAKISASSGANVTVAVVDELKAHASSGASVRYKGNPIKNISEVSSGASIKGLEN